MKMLALLAVAVAALGSTNVFAQGKTRAEVYQELIEAQQNGLSFVTRWPRRLRMRPCRGIEVVGRAAGKTKRPVSFRLTGLPNSWWGVSDSNTRPTD